MTSAEIASVRQVMLPMPSELCFTIEGGDGRRWTAHTPFPSPIGDGDRVAVTLDPAYITVVTA